MSQKRNFAIVGTGSRGAMFRKALQDTYQETCQLVAICDLNPIRMKAWAEDSSEELPQYTSDRFAEMIRTHKVNTVVVTTMDRTHHTYITQAMDLGCDVITEKPMTVDEVKCQEILDAQERTGKNLTVTFNYRYAPRNSKIKELLQQGVIGDVFSVHFEWLLNTKHGADYFRRWHRDKRNSGGLMVHKATHHFDLVNWWLDSEPETVFALGDLRFYGRENAEQRGITQFYQRAQGSELAKKDPYALHLEKNEWMKKIYLDAEPADGYQRDQSVFGHGISIEDDMSVMVRYRNRATMTYHLTAYSPWEGYRIAFNGSQGRLEMHVVESPYVSAGQGDHNFATNVLGAAPFKVEEPVSIIWHPHWEEPRRVELPSSNEGGHGGADPRMLKDIFEGAGEDPLGRAAGVRDGAYSILTGIAANRSFNTGLPVSINSIAPKQLRY